MVTVAPGSTPPCWSFTIPVIVPVSTCAKAGAENSSAVIANDVKQRQDTEDRMLIPSSVRSDRVMQRSILPSGNRSGECRREPSLTSHVLQAYPACSGREAHHSQHAYAHAPVSIATGRRTRISRGLSRPRGNGRADRAHDHRRRTHQAVHP